VSGASALYLTQGLKLIALREDEELKLKFPIGEPISDKVSGRNGGGNFLRNYRPQIAKALRDSGFLVGDYIKFEKCSDEDRCLKIIRVPGNSILDSNYSLPSTFDTDNQDTEKRKDFMKYWFEKIRRNSSRLV
jgi:hypothetical protein